MRFFKFYFWHVCEAEMCPRTAWILDFDAGLQIRVRRFDSGLRLQDPRGFRNT